ncbi:DUF4136 domain-containing protein [Catenovulum sp. SM1970]|uniref:DUF4136 domain-containing protein n=1 Tax=Marinifaba aquimaris TaxID=2741323 RepID=UPI001571DEDB|nr:DUF4136 domain-containing protein [Marinifaba aquimaris]NTS77234.1 DUF4136 domain-containing protein [Marinifaba aquimaris]
MNMIKLAFICLLAIALSACQTTYNPETDASPSYNFAKVKTFAIVGDEDNKNILLSDIDRERINSAIVQSLTNAGKRQVDEKDADVLIAYFVYTKDKTRVYSTGVTATYCYHCIYRPAPTVHVRNYTEGTLIVDMIDRETDKSIWRSSLSKSVKKTDNAQEKQQKIQAIIDSMIKQLPQA